MQTLLDVVCLGLSAAIGVDTALGRALLAISGVNIILTVLMIGENRRRRSLLLIAVLEVPGGLTLFVIFVDKTRATKEVSRFGRNVTGTDEILRGTYSTEERTDNTFAERTDNT